MSEPAAPAAPAAPVPPVPAPQPAEAVPPHENLLERAASEVGSWFHHAAANPEVAALLAEVKAEIHNRNGVAFDLAADVLQAARSNPELATLVPKVYELVESAAVLGRGLL